MLPSEGVQKCGRSMQASRKGVSFLCDHHNPLLQQQSLYESHEGSGG